MDIFAFSVFPVSDIGSPVLKVHHIFIKIILWYFKIFLVLLRILVLLQYIIFSTGSGYKGKLLVFKYIFLYLTIISNTHILIVFIILLQFLKQSFHAGIKTPIYPIINISCLIPFSKILKVLKEKDNSIHIFLVPDFNDTSLLAFYHYS